MRARLITAITLVAAGATAQDLELAGRVVGADGSPIARAKVSFAVLKVPVASTATRKGTYRGAFDRQRRAVRLPRTITDRDGAWRVVLTPAQAALATVDVMPFLMEVEASDHVPWRRSLGTDLRTATAEDARLERITEDAVLDLQLRGGGSPTWRGIVVVERPFRVSGNRAIWLRERVDLSADGRIRFVGRPRVSGERPAAAPTARVEAYRVTVWAADCDVLMAMLDPGRHELDVEPAPWQSRAIVAERGKPAQPPVNATWLVDGQTVELAFDTPRVPLLGSEPPVRVDTGSGPVEIDDWDPDVPMIVAREPRAADDDGEAAVFDTTGMVELAIETPDGRALFGAGVWLGDGAVRRAAPDATVFSTTDARGTARLAGIPRGSHYVLVHHPEHGEREGLVRVAERGKQLRVRLRGNGEQRAAPPPASGTLVLDLRSAGGGDETDAATIRTEVGILTDGGLLVRKRFDGRPNRIRLEGLVPGPTTFFVRVGDRPPVLHAGVLIRDDLGATFDAGAALERTIVLDVTTASGEPAEDVTVSLGERTGRELAPTSAGLFAVEPAGDGRFTVRFRGTGAPWLRARTEDGATADLACPAGDGIVPVQLGAPQAKPSGAEGQTAGDGPGPDKKKSDG